jgi:hypothetical protein
MNLVSVTALTSQLNLVKQQSTLVAYGAGHSLRGIMVQDNSMATTLTLNRTGFMLAVVSTRGPRANCLC